MTKLNLTLLEQTFTATLTENSVAQAVLAQLPVTLTINRSGENEYYQSLPTPIKATTKGTSQVQAGHLYYFAGSNAFSLNFADKNIAPYEVIEIGTFDEPNLTTLLAQGTSSMTVELALNKKD